MLKRKFLEFIAVFIEERVFVEEELSEEGGLI